VCACVAPSLPILFANRQALKFWCCAKLQLAQGSAGASGSNDFARARRRLPVIRHPRKRRQLHPLPPPAIVGTPLLSFLLARFSASLLFSFLRKQECRPTFAASLVVGHPARVRRRKTRYVSSPCIVWPCRRLASGLESAGGGTDFSYSKAGENVVANCYQKPATKKAAPKKTGRASRVVDDSEDDEEEEVK
jgi:hypothetical protein